MIRGCLHTIRISINFITLTCCGIPRGTYVADLPFVFNVNTRMFWLCIIVPAFDPSLFLPGII